MQEAQNPSKADRYSVNTAAARAWLTDRTHGKACKTRESTNSRPRKYFHVPRSYSIPPVLKKKKMTASFSCASSKRLEISDTQTTDACLCPTRFACITQRLGKVPLSKKQMQFPPDLIPSRPNSISTCRHPHRVANLSTSDYSGSTPPHPPAAAIKSRS